MVEFQIEGDVNIAGSRIIVPVAIATVLPGIVVPVTGTVSVGTIAYVGTLGTVLSPIAVSGTVGVSGTVTTAGGGTVAVSTVLSPVPVTGTLLATGTVYDIPVGGTLGTILSPVQITEVGATVVFATISATISAVSGTLYGVTVANLNQFAATLSGTLLLSFSSGQQLVVVVAPGQTGGFMLDRGMMFTGSLVASLMGTLSVSVFH